MKQKLLNFLYNNKYLLLSLALLLLGQLFDITDAWADDATNTTNSSGTTSSGDKTGSVLVNVRNSAAYVIERVKAIAYVLGGFGLVGVAWGAIFGKINWKWFSSLAIGLFIISWMGMTIDYFTGKSKNAESAFVTTGIDKSYFADTLTESGATGTGTTNATSDHEMTEEEKAAQAAEEAEAARQKWCSDNFSQCLSCGSLAMTQVCKQCQSNKCNESTNGNTNNDNPGDTTTPSGTTSDADNPSGTTTTSGNTDDGEDFCKKNSMLCDECNGFNASNPICMQCASHNCDSSCSDCSKLSPGGSKWCKCGCDKKYDSRCDALDEQCDACEDSDCNACTEYLNKCTCV